MKRTAEKTCQISKVIINWFWTRCDLCESQFKKESMWRLKFPRYWITRYICTECAPDYVKAEYLSHTWGENGNLKPRLRHTPIRHPRLKGDA